MSLYSPGWTQVSASCHRLLSVGIVSTHNHPCFPSVLEYSELGGWASAGDASGTPFKEGTVCVSASQSLAVSQSSLPDFLVKSICLPRLAASQRPPSAMVWRGLLAGRASGEKKVESLGPPSTEVLSSLPHPHPACNKTSSFALSSSLSASRKQSWKGTVLKGSAGTVPLTGRDSKEAMVPLSSKYSQIPSEPRAGSHGFFACGVALASGAWEAALLAWMPVQTQTAEGARRLLLSLRGCKPGHHVLEPGGSARMDLPLGNSDLLKRMPAPAPMASTLLGPSVIFLPNSRPVSFSDVMLCVSDKQPGSQFQWIKIHFFLGRCRKIKGTELRF